MALSNWDVMAFDTEGKPGNGVLTIPSGASVEIYKNWLYVRHPDMWVEGNSFVSPTIAQVDSGHLILGGFRITAERCDQQAAIFCYVEHTQYGEDGKKSFIMAGIGCYGYLSAVEYIKRHHPQVYADKLQCHIDKDPDIVSNWSFGDRWGIGLYVFSQDEHAEVDKHVEVDLTDDLDQDEMYDNAWVGVEDSTVDAFFGWMEDIKPDYAAKIDRDSALRFNQGDAFFGAPQATKPGEQRPTIMSQIIKDMKDKEE